MNELDPAQCQCEQNGNHACDPKSFVVALFVIKLREEAQALIEVVAESFRVESTRDDLAENLGASLDAVCHRGRVGGDRLSALAYRLT